jgi:tripartite-type tricarboxylate transporter receptor subunit TctC
MEVSPRPARSGRRRCIAALSAAAVAPALAAVHAAAAERFPSRPISLWVPWPAGGATDLTLRLLADLAARTLGQKVLVENRSGAGGTLVMPVLQQAAPDGYTIAQMPQPVFRAPFTQKVCGTRCATPRPSSRSAASPSVWWCRPAAPGAASTKCLPGRASTLAG